MYGPFPKDCMCPPGEMFSVDSDEMPVPHF